MNEPTRDYDDYEEPVQTEEHDYELDELDALFKLSKDLKDASCLLSQREAIWLVKSYYVWQEGRIAAGSRVKKSEKHGTPNAVLEWSFRNMTIVEKNIQNALGHFVKQYRVGNWLMSICGINKTISAGLLAHLDIRDRHVPSAFWSFAGMDPNAVWGKKEKRPWNADLKKLLWKAGESFVKVSNNKNDVYGKVYAKRKKLEWSRNLTGQFVKEAERALHGKNYKTNTLAYRFYSGQMSPSVVQAYLEKGGVPMDAKATSVGDEVAMLPPGHIHARSTRYAAKLFLSHIHHVMHEDYYGEAPILPYAFSHLDGHNDYFPPPNWPGDHKGKSLKELLVLSKDED